MSRLTIGNEDFLIKSHIERCPNTMMLRELVKNALESASGSKEKEIRIRGTTYMGTPKLSIWNTGRGMTQQELRDACNLSQSFRKENSLSENFGMGAKVASLAVNKFGMRYRSCHRGKVSEVVMGLEKDEDGSEKYTRFDYSHGTLTDFSDIEDVTCKFESKDLLFDWTEVVLYGNEAKQDTIKDPFNGDPSVHKLWIANSLYHRFWELPEGIKILLEEGTQAKGGQRNFLPFPKVLEKAKQKHKDEICYEKVMLNDGTIIHFSYDHPNKVVQHNTTYNFTSASDLSFSGIVFKGEIYDFKTSNKWYNQAPSLGISFGQKHICVLIELTDDAKVLPEANREELRWSDSEKTRVVVDYFAKQIIDNRPSWLKEKIAQHTPKSGNSENITKELKDLIQELRVIDLAHFSKKDGSDSGGVDPDGKQSQHLRDGKNKCGSDNSEKRRRPLTDLGKVKKMKKSTDIPIPEFYVLTSEKELEEHQDLIGRAGKYEQNTNKAFINMRYASASKMTELFIQEYSFVSDKEALRDIVVKCAQDFFKLQIGKSIVFSLHKRKADRWTQEHVEKALSSETFSVVADNWIDYKTKIRQRLSTSFKKVQRTCA